MSRAIALLICRLLHPRTGAAASAASEDSRLRAQDLISAEPFLMNEASEGEWRQIKEEGEGGSLISLYIKFYLSSEENMGRWICQET